jgi:hypothetical protein
MKTTTSVETSERMRYVRHRFQELRDAPCLPEKQLYCALTIEILATGFLTILWSSSGPKTSKRLFPVLLPAAVLGFGDMSE